MNVFALCAEEFHLTISEQEPSYRRHNQRWGARRRKAATFRATIHRALPAWYAPARPADADQSARVYEAIAAAPVLNSGGKSATRPVFDGMNQVALFFVAKTLHR
jgi:hypothetical protein